MGEVIAIPLASERRAATVLAALRRLAAGHQTGRPAGGRVRRSVDLAGAGVRRVRQTVCQGAEYAVTGGVVGFSVAGACAVASRRASWLTGPVEEAIGPFLALLFGLVLGVVLGVALDAIGRRRRAAHDVGGFTRLVPPGAAARQGDALARGYPAVRITLPESAERELRAILGREVARAND
jgi:hypothetical protein